jgi:DNA-binding GntR family transcriptional regulator
MKRRPERRPPRKGDVDTDAAVYHAIRQAMLSGRLPPGLKLREPTLARALGVSRERVRKALHRLVHERWLDSVPNRGTFVPTPSVEELHEIYEARRILEVAVARKLAATHDEEDARRLKEHVRRERSALRGADRGQLFRLSAEFHFLLGELCGNGQLRDILRALMTRSSLHYSLYGPKHLENCAGPHDHQDIVAAMLERNAAKAAALMLDHLTGLEALLSTRDSAPPPVDLAELFRNIVILGKRRRGSTRPRGATRRLRRAAAGGPS